MKSGIYSIINEVNGKFYIGQAQNIKKRWANHIRDLRKGIHRNKHLWRAWKKYGEGSFYFGVLEPVEDLACLTDREQYWMDLLKPEYNVYLVAGSPSGYKHTEEFRRKQSERMSGKNNPNYGKHPTEEARQKNVEAHRGVALSEEQRHKISKALSGVPKSEDFRQKISGENNHSYKTAKLYEYNGKSQPLSDWAREYGFKPMQIQVRVQSLGWSLERALLTPVIRRKH